MTTLLLIVAVALVAIAVGSFLTGYRLGYDNGHDHGRRAERLRALSTTHITWETPRVSGRNHLQ